jgi:hypothetical protein
MAIIQTSAASSGSAIVDPTMQAIRISERPPEILGAYQLGVISGLLTGVAAGGVVYGFRFGGSVATNLCMIRKVEIGMSSTTAFGTAQTLQYSMQIARSFTAPYSTGGTAAAFTQTNTGKMRSSMPTSQIALTSGNIYMAGTTAITGATNTPDTQVIAYVNGTSNATLPTIPLTAIYQHQSGDYPLILAANEGFIINNVTAMGASGVVSLYVSVEWMELSQTSGNVIAY